MLSLQKVVTVEKEEDFSESERGAEGKRSYEENCALRTFCAVRMRLGIKVPVN